VIDLEKRISGDLLAAMKEKKEMELSSLRMLKAEFQRAKTEKGHAGELTEDEVVSLVQRLVKQRREAADQYTAVGAGDRAAQELKEALFLETYLPEQLSDEELGQIVEEGGRIRESRRSQGHGPGHGQGHDGSQGPCRREEGKGQGSGVSPVPRGVAFFPALRAIRKISSKQKAGETRLFFIPFLCHFPGDIVDNRL
jgi:Uncharacterized conserved protein